MDAPCATRRVTLEKLSATARPLIHLTPATEDPDVANDWFLASKGPGSTASWPSRATCTTYPTSGP